MELKKVKKKYKKYMRTVCNGNIIWYECLALRWRGEDTICKIHDHCWREK